jgi:PAS domain S-box-containing protein
MHLLSRHFVLVTLAALAAIFLASLQLDPAYAINSLYVLPILLAVWAPRRRAAYRVAAAATSLVVASSVLTAPLLPPQIFTRAQLVMVYWLTAAIIVQYRRTDAERQTEVTERRRAERALRLSVKDLEDLKYALDQSAIVATTNVRGDITYVNDKFCEISKYDRQELLGRNHRILNSGLHPTTFFKEMYAAIANGRVWRGEIRNRARDGTLYWVDTTVVPVLAEDRRPQQYIAIRYDITERKQSEAALRDQNALAQLGKMAAVVAHEVRNPLAGIRGALQVIGRRLPEAGQERGIVSDIVARIDTLNEIVQDLLLFARPTQPSLVSAPVTDVVRETVMLFKQDAQTRNVIVDVQSTDAVVTTDPQQLKLVLLNLLMNGSDAMHGAGRLTVETQPRDGHWEIRICDEGPGITPEVQERLFEPFFTTRHRGTGLGLVTARRLVEAQSGSLRLECPATGGTVAIVTLPAGKRAA